MLEGPSKASLKWAFLYELVYLAVALPTGLALFKSPTLKALPFIKGHGALYSVLCIWLNNVASFFLGGAFVVVAPLAGLFTSAYLGVFGGQVIASFLSSKCPLSHLIYALLLEDQAYVVLWSTTTRVYYAQKECESLTCKWSETLRALKKVMVVAFLTFFILAIIEVTEVRLFA